MKIDLAYTGHITGVESAAQEAGRAGFECFWSSETKHDPFLTLTLAARACPEIGVGAGVAVALARNPYSVAQSAWDLASLSGGRFRLGLGSQVRAHVERRFSMPWYKPVAQMRDFVSAVRAVFRAFQSGEKLHYEGEYYRHTLLIPNFNPGPIEDPNIPLGIAAVGPRMTALAGEIADFVLLHPFTTVEFLRRRTLPSLGDGLTKAGRTRDQIETVGTLFAFAEGTQAEEFDRIVRQKVAFYGSTPAYFGVLEASGRAELGPELHRLSKRGEWEKMSSLIDDDLLQEFRIRAPEEELFRRVRERFHGLYDRAVLTVPGR